MKFFKNILQWLTAIVSAIAVINIFMCGYYNLPYKSNIYGGATKTVWETNSAVVDGIEGYGINRTDENGYNNPYGAAHKDKLILVLGSSHTQAFNVNQNENYCSLLNEKFADNGINYSVYNAGMDAHDFKDAVACMPDAVKKFKPDKIVIEFYNISIKQAELEAALKEAEKRKSEVATEAVQQNQLPLKDKLIHSVQSVPFVRLAYRQLALMLAQTQMQNRNAFVSEQKQDNTIVTSPPPSAEYIKVLDKTLSSLKDSVGDAQLVILYHTHIYLDENYKLFTKTNSDYYNAFTDSCSRHGIDFIDMYDAFSKEYYKSRTLPYGFNNSSAFYAHLNKFGHSIIADTLYEHLGKTEVEAQ